MHITRLQAENFKKIRAIDIQPSTAAGVVPIRGRNAQGKSSTLDAIQAALGGKSVMPSRPVRAGEEGGAIRVELDNGALVIRRTFDADGGGTIVVENAEGFRPGSPQKMLDGLYASVAFDPLAFTRLDADKQFNVLRGLVKLDVDIDALAAANKADHAERTIVNREVKERAAQLPAHRVSGIIPDALIDEEAIERRIAEAGEHNLQIERRKNGRAAVAAEIEQHRHDIAVCNVNISEQRHIIEAAEKKIERETNIIAGQNAEIEAKQAKLDGAEPLPDPIDTTAVAAELRDARQSNQRLAAHAQYLALEASLEKRRADAEELTKAMEARDTLRREAIQRAEMPVPGLSFGDGEVLFNGLPLDQASSAEQLRVSTAIGMAGNPKLRVMLVRDGSLLDDEGQTILAQLAEANDFQLWIEAVDESGKVGIILEDGNVKDAPTPEPIATGRRKKKPAPEQEQSDDEGAGPRVVADLSGSMFDDPEGRDPDRLRDDHEERKRLAREQPVSLFDD